MAVLKPMALQLTSTLVNSLSLSEELNSGAFNESNFDYHKTNKRSAQVVVCVRRGARPTILLLKAVASLELVYFCAVLVNGREER